MSTIALPHTTTEWRTCSLYFVLFCYFSPYLYVSIFFFFLLPLVLVNKDLYNIRWSPTAGLDNPAVRIKPMLQETLLLSGRVVEPRCQVRRHRARAAAASNAADDSAARHPQSSRSSRSRVGRRLSHVAVRCRWRVLCSSRRLRSGKCSVGVMAAAASS